jgi:CII-binding regulator of phage lambda lysogenization HflD
VAIDYHTLENRNKRNAMQERRNALGKQMQFMLQNHEEGQKAMTNLYQSIESNLGARQACGGVGVEGGED